MAKIPDNTYGDTAMPEALIEVEFFQDLWRDGVPPDVEVVRVGEGQFVRASVALDWLEEKYAALVDAGQVGSKTIVCYGSEE